MSEVLEVIDGRGRGRPHRDRGCEHINEPKGANEDKCPWVNDIRSDNSVGLKAIKLQNPGKQRGHAIEEQCLGSGRQNERAGCNREKGEKRVKAKKKSCYAALG